MNPFGWRSDTQAYWEANPELKQFFANSNSFGVWAGKRGFVFADNGKTLQKIIKDRKFYLANRYKNNNLTQDRIRRLEDLFFDLVESQNNPITGNDILNALKKEGLVK